MIKVVVLIAALFILLMQATPGRVTTMIRGANLAPPLLQTAQAIAILLPRDVQNAFRHSDSHVRQRSGEQPAQPSVPKPETSHSALQGDKPPTAISENDERALRQLIQKHSKNP
jgi:hypothetical protein